MPIMGLGRRLLRWALSGPTLRTFSASGPIDRVLSEMMGAGAAPRVSRAEALTVPAVQRGRNMICSVATLPLERVDAQQNVVRSPLLEQIDPDVPNVVTMAQTIEDLLFEGIAWWRILGVGYDLFPYSARRIDPNTVSLNPPGDVSPAPLPSGHDPRGAAVWVDGVRVPADEVIRFDSPNPAVLKAAGRAIRRAILLDQAGAMYAKDPRPLDYFTTAENHDEPEDEETGNFLTRWLSARRRRATAWVPGWAKYVTVDSPSPADLQLAELTKEAKLDIANALGVDPEDLGVSTTSRTYANAVDRRIDRINNVLAPYMDAITDRLSMNDVTPRGHTVRFNLLGYMKSNPTERYVVHAQAITLGIYDKEEARAMEGLPARTAVTSDVAAAPTSDGSPSPVGAVAAPVLTFAGPQLRTMNVSVHGFAVDTQARTITGLALPFDQITEKYGVRIRFDRGSLQFGEPSRNKMLRDHDKSQAIGAGVQLVETPEGYRSQHRIARGAEGDRALELAEDGVLDGLSVGVQFDLAADTVPDPENKGVLLVKRASWYETSLTAMPAFDDARVTTVTASLNGGTVPDTTPATPATPTPATPASGPATVTLTAEQLAAFAAGGVPPREPVNPTVVSAGFVREPAPYRFDRKGNLLAGAHEFSADLIAGLRDGDKAANDRVMGFIRAQFDVVTGDVNELNVPANRPELYVDQRDFKYPVWAAINKGTLTEITPFTFPKFNSAAGLVGAHTEGVEPTSGTYTVTNQTVTPSAVSGKMKISRETWDQGGNPQIGNLIWQQMVKSWFEALEAAAIAVLDAATPTAIALTAGGGTTGQTLAAEIKAALTVLQFVRGGFAFTDAFTQIDLYKALAAALDDAGRPLFPILGPTNADGTAEPRLSAIMVDGVQFLPSWALAATGAVVASSYLFDKQSVHGWASAPQRLTIDAIEVANVFIGLWGYKATAISDITGVREITYDPVA
jgi:HK97 family phage prohead protease